AGPAGLAEVLGPEAAAVAGRVQPAQDLAEVELPLAEEDLLGGRPASAQVAHLRVVDPPLEHVDQRRDVAAHDVHAGTEAGPGVRARARVDQAPDVGVAAPQVGAPPAG